jgi:hypothetical protein
MYYSAAATAEDTLREVVLIKIWGDLTSHFQCIRGYLDFFTGHILCTGILVVPLHMYIYFSVYVYSSQQQLI